MTIIIGDEKSAELAELMADCAQASYDDRELTVLGAGVNASEATSVLEVVA